MAGTRTAPTVDGAPAFWHVAFQFIDASGDLRTISGDFDDDMTDAEVESLAVSLQAVTQSNLVRVEKTAVYSGAVTVSGATNLQRSSVFDQVILRAKSPTLNLGYSWEIPAPITALFVGDTDQINTASVPLGAVMTALGAGKAGYGFVSTRYTERKEINKAQRL